MFIFFRNAQEKEVDKGREQDHQNKILPKGDLIKSVQEKYLTNRTVAQIRVKINNILKNKGVDFHGIQFLEYL